MKKILLSIILITLLSFPLISHATQSISCTTGDNSTCSLTNPIPGIDVNNKPNINILIGRVINTVLGVVGSLALVMFIYGGLTWMLAAGNNERVNKGKDILIWATLGLVIIFTAYALVKFVFVGLGVT